ncbi:MAG: replicative DNA helicase [bacterium]|nr:replicative DNA helicase [bacterium]
MKPAEGSSGDGGLALRVPPQDRDAERAVLGAIFFEPESINKIIDIIQPDRFYDPAHRKIFASMLDLHNRGILPDLVTLKDELISRNELDEVGGISYLMTLLDSTPTAANIKYYAQILHKKFMARQLIAAATQIAQRGYEEHKEIESLLDDAERLILSISENRANQGVQSIREIISNSFQVIEKLYESKTRVTGLPTGFVDFDALTSGLQNSDLIIIAGRPSMGKTSLCMNIAQHVALEVGTTVLIFSLEMAKEQIVLRMLCSEAEVSSHKLRTGYLSERDWEKLVRAAAKLSEAKIYIDDSVSITVMEMRAKARRLRKEAGLGLIIVDYLQLVQGHGRHESRQQEISGISRSLKGLAKDMNIPVIALSQLSRAVETRDKKDKRPILSDLRESGAIEQDADLIAFLYRPEFYNPEDEPGVAELIIGKQRNGPIGTTKLAFLKEFTKFKNLAREDGFF